MKKAIILLVVLVALAAGYIALDRYLHPPLPQLGVQAYTFRRFTLAEAMEKSSNLGIHYMEAFPGQTLGGGLEGKFHHTMSEASRRGILELAKARDIKIVSYGVVNGKDEAEWRQIFAFAKAMGLRNVTAEPPQEILPMLDKLSRESGITLAFHNHPQPSRYANPQVALDALKPFGSNLGVCADTGHWVRSGYDPVQSLQLLRGKILESHFKDLDQWTKAAKDVPWGTGTSNASGQLAELRRQRFGGVVLIEYENDTPQLESNVKRCVEYFNLAMKAPLNDLAAGKVSPPGFTANVEQVVTDPTPKSSEHWPEPIPLLAADFGNALLDPPNSWSWQNDVLTSLAGSTLWTTESYGNFILSLEYRCAEKSSGGVWLRTNDPTKPLDTPLKLQIVQGEVANNKEENGAIMDCLSPTRSIPVHVGEWNSYMIKVQGAMIRVFLNHEEIINMNLDDWKDAGKNPDGTPNAGVKAYKDRERTGHIGLQSSEVPIEFRNVRIEKI